MNRIAQKRGDDTRVFIITSRSRGASVGPRTSRVMDRHPARRIYICTCKAASEVKRRQILADLSCSATTAHRESLRDATQ
ncbi:hypothetical protein EVAR_51339_1 [Eumeta japonica]|uniref:Uncharacterized protein n=1 Tax=Eumeta variegata TaxID=151549 RepID=A0A4C1Y127_EUMVA|nr:hypothetical protein EVAR_51339_1 [Eumeta japonica]